MLHYTLKNYRDIPEEIDYNAHSSKESSQAYHRNKRFVLQKETFKKTIIKIY